MKKVVLLRHGESLWNKENLFTGWTDVELSEKGLQEAVEAGRVLRSEGYVFDVAFTSVLKRAIKTLWLALEEMDLMWIPVHNSWRLNERHYGALQGLNKVAMVDRFGAQQVQTLAPQLRRPSTGAGTRRRTVARKRSSVCRPGRKGHSHGRMSQRHRRARAPLLA